MAVNQPNVYTVTINGRPDQASTQSPGGGRPVVGTPNIDVSGNNRPDVVNINIGNGFQGMPAKTPEDRLPTIRVGTEDVVDFSMPAALAKTTQLGAGQGGALLFDFNGDGQADLRLLPGKPPAGGGGGR